MGTFLPIFLVLVRRLSLVFDSDLVPLTDNPVAGFLAGGRGGAFLEGDSGDVGEESSLSNDAMSGRLAILLALTGVLVWSGLRGDNGPGENLGEGNVRGDGFTGV